jgi:very-short-patch-repair endonuclease
MFNARLFTAGGAFIATPDAWWPEAGVAAEVDSREWHLSPADWERTMSRRATMTSRGILVLHFRPSQIRSEPATVIATLADTLQTGRARPALPITARQAA